MKPLTDIFRPAPPAAGRALVMDAQARQRIARQIAETTGVVTFFGDTAAAPEAR